MATDNAVAAPEPGSRWEDLVDVFFSPVELFRRRAHDNWFKPFLLLCAISIVLYYVFMPINAELWEAIMLENAPAGADPEQLRRGAAFMKYLGGVFVPINYLFMIAFTALALKFVSALLEPVAKWGQAFTIATYAAYVVVLQQIIGTILVFFKARSGPVGMRDVSFGVLRFVDAPDAVVRTLLGRLDLFAIWTAVLCGLGLVVMVGMSRGRAAICAVVAWLAVALPGLASAAIFSGR